MDDSSICGYEFSGKFFHPTLNQLTLWPLESWILAQNTQKYDEIWQGALNFFKHILNICLHFGCTAKAGQAGPKFKKVRQTQQSDDLMADKKLLRP